MTHHFTYPDTYLLAKPKIYVHYVDAIFILPKNKKEFDNLKTTFETNSVFKFTYELCKTPILRRSRRIP